MNRGRQIRFVDQFAARSVYDAHAFFHFGDVFRVDHVARLRDDGGVEGDEIGLGEELLEGDEVDGEFAGGGFADEGIECEDAHIKGFGAEGNFAADATEADEAESLAADFGAGGGFLPAAFAHGGVELGELTNEGEEECESVLGDADGAAARSAHDEDAAFRGGFEVDVVDANAGAADGAEVGSFVEEVGGDFGGAPDDEGVGGREFGEERVFVGEDDLPVGLIPEELDAAVADLVGYDDFH